MDPVIYGEKSANFFESEYSRLGLHTVLKEAMNMSEGNPCPHFSRGSAPATLSEATNEVLLTP